MTENNANGELQFAPGHDDKWRPENATVHQLCDGSPVVIAWKDR